MLQLIDRLQLANIRKSKKLTNKKLTSWLSEIPITHSAKKQKISRKCIFLRTFSYRKVLKYRKVFFRILTSFFFVLL